MGLNLDHDLDAFDSFQSSKADPKTNKEEEESSCYVPKDCSPEASTAGHASSSSSSFHLF